MGKKLIRGPPSGPKSAVPTDDLTAEDPPRGNPDRPRRTASSETAKAGKIGFVNDPSAGSPTETLLRLLLPLNDQV